jgi:hypothetical protein
MAQPYTNLAVDFVIKNTLYHMTYREFLYFCELEFTVFISWICRLVLTTVSFSVPSRYHVDANLYYVLHS